MARRVGLRLLGHPQDLRSGKVPGGNVIRCARTDTQRNSAARYCLQPGVEHTFM